MASSCPAAPSPAWISAAGRDGIRGCCAGCCRTARCWPRRTSRRPCWRGSGPPAAATPWGGPAAGGRRKLPLRTASLDLVTAFNCVHHFDLARSWPPSPGCCGPAASCSSTPAPRSRTRERSGRCFPGFTEHEERLHSQAAIRDAVRRTDGLTMVATDTFQHPRTSTAERLGAQARGRHYSTSPSALRRRARSHRNLPGSPARPRGLLG